MPKKIKIEISYEAHVDDDLASQEIRETIEGLRNSLLSQVGNLSINISEK